MGARPNLVGRFWYDCVFWSTFTFWTFASSLRRGGWGNVPKDGPVLLVANHQSMLDPNLIGLSCRRYLMYLARKNLFEQPVLGWFIRSVNAVPIDRGFGKEGIQSVLDALARGGAVLMFPEGERTHTGEVQPLKPGVSLLIKRVKCPIVPVGVAGTYAAFNRHMKFPRFSPLLLPPGPATIAISVGKPIDPDRYKGMDRDAMLADLREQLVKQAAEAEKLRRK
jgi:1-acyl-sn-glycerol-3-phosphate acyltransferase